MSVERVHALLGNPPLETGVRRDFENQQSIFPSITFTCSGEIIKWIMAGTSSKGTQFPQLQIWRPSGATTYEKQSSSVISVAQTQAVGVYEFPVEPPLPFQPGDVLGVLQPPGNLSGLQAVYDDGGSSLHYYSEGDGDIDVLDTANMASLAVLPLVSVEIG